MFRAAPAPVAAVDVAPVVDVPADPIPLSVLELHLPAPTTGWLAELDRRGIRLFSMMLVGARLVVWMPDCCLLSGVRMRRVSGRGGRLRNGRRLRLMRSGVGSCAVAYRRI